MEPILIDVPDRIDTERLVLRAPRAGDGQRVNDAIRVSHARLAPWMPWAGTMPSVGESEAHCRRQQARFILREDFVLLMFLRGADGMRRRAGRRDRAAPDRLDAAQVRDRLLEEDRLRRARPGHRGGSRAGPPRLRFARRTPGRNPHGRQQRGELARRGAGRLHARGAAALRFGDAGRRAAQHAHLCARSRRRRADGTDGVDGACGTRCASPRRRRRARSDRPRR